MKTIPIIACANSRLQADMMLIRLRRVGIPCRKIAAFFQRHRVPNSVACWLKVTEKPATAAGRDTVMLAGNLGERLPTKLDAHAVTDLLTGIGIDAPSARAFWEKLSEGKIVLVVLALHETEASLAWHIFRHVSAEQIAVGATMARILSAQREEKGAAGPGGLTWGNDSEVLFGEGRTEEAEEVAESFSGWKR